MRLWDTFKKPFKWWHEFLERQTIVADFWSLLRWPIGIILAFFLLLWFAASSGSGDLWFFVMLLPYAIFGLVALAGTLEGQIFLVVLFAVWQLFKRWTKNKQEGTRARAIFTRNKSRTTFSHAYTREESNHGQSTHI